LALLREWEGWFRRYSDGMGTGECSLESFYQHVLFFVITWVYGGIGTCGKHRNKCGDPWEDHEVVLCLTYTSVITDSLIVEKSRADLRARANERSITGGKLTFHIPPPECLSSR